MNFMDLETIMAVTGLGTVFVYLEIDKLRAEHIEKQTNHLIFDTGARHTAEFPFQLPEKQLFYRSGIESYRAVRRYEKVYAALQENGEGMNFNQIMDLFKID